MCSILILIPYNVFDMQEITLISLGFGGAIVSLRLVEKQLTRWEIFFTLLSGILISISVTPSLCEYFNSSINFCKMIAFGCGVGSRQISEFVITVFEWLKKRPMEAVKKLFGL